RLRNGPRPQRAQNVCTQLVVASTSDCGRGKAPPPRCNQIRPPVLRLRMRLSFDNLQQKNRSITLNSHENIYDRNVRKGALADKYFSRCASQRRASTYGVTRVIRRGYRAQRYAVLQMTVVYAVAWASTAVSAAAGGPALARLK